MTAEIYRPTIQLQLKGGCAIGGLSCTSFAVAMAGDRATLGKVVPKGCSVRHYTGDSIGGTTLRQNTGVLFNHYHIPMTTHFYASWEDFLDSLNEGRGASAQFSYAPIRASKYRGSETFNKGHAGFFNEHDKLRKKTLAYDPLADGRRNLAKGPDWWPDSLLKEAAGELILGESGNRVGHGKIWYADTRITHLVAGQVPLNTTDFGRNGVIAAIQDFQDSVYVLSVPKLTTFYREPKGKGLGRMVSVANLPVVGNAGGGWKAVVVNTGTPYKDKIARPSVVYMPASAGTQQPREFI